MVNFEISIKSSAKVLKGDMCLVVKTPTLNGTEWRKGNVLWGHDGEAPTWPMVFSGEVRIDDGPTRWYELDLSGRYPRLELQPEWYNDVQGALEDSCIALDPLKRFAEANIGKLKQYAWVHVRSMTHAALNVAREALYKAEVEADLRLDAMREYHRVG